jgi:hypothetical protein
MKNSSKGGPPPLPKGAHSSGVHGTAAHRALQGAPRPKPVTIDNSFVANPQGGKTLAIGKGHIEVKGNRSNPSR